MDDEPTVPDHSLTRRQALAAAGAAGVAGAALASPGASAAARARPRPRRADVLVIGGGLAGLQAARSLVAAGRSVLVLEARDRVGGRTLNRPLGRRYPGKVVEVGGQWVGPTQDRLLALAQELKVPTFKTYDQGQGVLLYQGARTPFDLGGAAGPIPPVPDSLIQTATAIAEIDRLAGTIDVRRPWAAPDATTLDGQTFETFKLGQASSPGARFLIDLGFTSVFATEPRDVSLLWALFYIASAGNERTKGSFLRLLNTAGGAQERRFRGGSQQIALRMAAALGARVVLGTPARRVEQDRAGVEVTTDRGVYRGRRAIVALPPTLAGRLVYEPALPVARDGLTQRMPMGVVIKVNVVYPEPFWRAAGLAGYTNSDSDCVRLTYDNSPPDGRPGILLGFIEGENARRWGARTPAARRAAVLRDLVAAYGPRAARPTGYLEQSWAAEPYSRGCYGGYAPPGLLTAVGPALREPVGRIHWAGTETSDYWNGYMEGALRSGARAAGEV